MLTPVSENDDGPRPISRRRLLAGAAVAGASVAATQLLGRSTEADAVVAPATEPSQPGPAIEGAVPVTLKVNGQMHDLQLEPRVTLLDALREHIGLTGSKKGCDHGQCGACTVLIEGRRINSCLQLAIMHQGHEIITIEGLADGSKLHPVQAAFVEHDGFQCGYCTPGQICSAVGLIKEGHCKNDEDIREEMSGNICRCGAYANIVAAVREAMGKA